MKKNGFTLTELLITIGIVGLVATLVTPALRNIMPDKYKFKVLDYYNLIDSAASDLLADKVLYNGLRVTGDVNEPFDRDCDGFECDMVPTTRYYDEHASITNENKFQVLMQEKLGIDRDTNLYKDGSEWILRPAIEPQSIQGVVINEGEEGYYHIFIDLEPDNPDSCQVSNNRVLGKKDACSNPTQYSFIVDEYGNVSGRDLLTQVYLENATVTRSRRESLTEARARQRVERPAAVNPITPPVRPELGS